MLKPTIEIKDITNTQFTIEVKNNYEEGYITEYKYYVEGSVKSQGTTDKEYKVTGLTPETTYSNVYVEAYMGNEKIASTVTSATTIPTVLTRDTHTVTNSTYTWEELEMLAREISNNDNKVSRDAQEVQVIIDETKHIVGVGDTTKVTVNGVAKTVRIMGFNHDKLTDTAAYGGENTYAGISFEFADIIEDAQINSTYTNSGGWAASELRQTLNNTTINTLSNKALIKEVQKSYISIPNSASSVTTCSDKLWLLSCSEIYNNSSDGKYGYAQAKEGEQYKFYKNINVGWATGSKEHLKNSKSTWLRSPGYISGWWCKIGWSGGHAYDSANATIGIAPGFTI